MTTAAIGPARPTQHLPRWFLRVPELFFVLHLSRLVPWLVMVVTTGRRTGRARRVVLDVARREEHGLWVLAADGREARWVKNLLADPGCVVWHRGRRFAARATVSALDPGDLAAEIYRDRPSYIKLVYLAVGERIRSEADARRLAAGAVPVFLEEIRPSTQER
jgi:deazaflavin-dependent oxidoreductase (nitroreductase family)